MAKRREYLWNTTHSQFLDGLAQDIDSKSGKLITWSDFSAEQVREIHVRLLRVSDLLKQVGG